MEKDDTAQLIDLMKRILTISDKVSSIVLILQSGPLPSDDNTNKKVAGKCPSAVGSDEQYMAAMKPVQFGL